VKKTTNNTYHSPVANNVIFACHLTGIYDVNRNTTLPDDDYTIIKAWADSIMNLQLKGIIFHNNFSPKTCTTYQNDYLEFIKIDPDPRFKPNVYRYLAYQDYLKSHSDDITNLFLTDVSDVVVVQNPFIQPLYQQNKAALFCGDEPKILHNEWMQAHSEHLRRKIADYASYEKKFA